MKLFAGILGFLVFGFGLLCALAVVVLITNPVLEANVIPVSFVALGLGAILLTYGIVPRKSE